MIWEVTLALASLSIYTGFNTYRIMKLEQSLRTARELVEQAHNIALKSDKTSTTTIRRLDGIQKRFDTLQGITKVRKPRETFTPKI